MIRAIIASFSQYKGLPREVYILALQRFINSVGGFVHPLLISILTLRLGLTKAEAGTYIFISAVAGLPGSLIAGYLADRYNRKLILVCSRVICAITYIICGFLGYSMTIVYLIMFASFVWSFSAPASGAMTADLTTPENRKQSFSLLYLCMNVGLAIGFALAGYLFEDHMDWLFWGDGITSLLALSLVIFFIKDTRPDRKAIDAINKSSSRTGEKEESSLFRAFIRRPFLVAFVIINSILGFVYFQHNFTMPIHLNGLYNLDGPKMFSNIMVVNTLIVVVFTPILMHLTAKIKPVLNVAIAAFTYIIGFGMLAFANTLWPFFVAVFIWTAGEIIAMANTGVYISNHSPVNKRGMFNSMLNLIQFAGRASSPLIMGAFLEGRNIASGWVLTAVVATVAFIMLILLDKKEKQHKQRMESSVTLQSEGVA